MVKVPCKSSNYYSRHTEEWQEFKTEAIAIEANMNSVSEHTIQEVQQLQRPPSRTSMKVTAPK